MELNESVQKMNGHFQIPFPDFPFHRGSNKRATAENIQRFRRIVRDSAGGVQPCDKDEVVSLTLRFYQVGAYDLTI